MAGDAQVRHDAARWVWIGQQRPNDYVALRLVFDVPPGPGTQAVVDVSASSHYLLYANGEYLGRGPVRQWRGHSGLDRWSVPLRSGPNVISALVYYCGAVAGSSPSNPPGFYLAGGAGEIGLSTGQAPWQAVRAPGFGQASRVSLYQAFNEEIDMAAYRPELWEQGVDGPWGNAQVTTALTAATLDPREIEFYRQAQPSLAPRVLAAGHYDEPSPPSDNWAARMAGERHRPMSLGACLPRGEGAFPLRLGAGEPAYVIVDLTREVSGVLGLEIRAQGGEELRIGYADRLWQGGKTFRPLTDEVSINPRDNISLELRPNHGLTPEGGGGANVDRLVLRPGVNRWQGHFMLRGYRYAKLSLSKRSGPVEITRLSPCEIAYPVEHRGRFLSSDRELNAIWEQSALTARLCMSETFMDNPSRERQQYSGDARPQCQYAYGYFGETRLARQLLRQMAQAVAANGEQQGGGPWPWMQIMTSWTLHWIEAIREYIDYTDDGGIAGELAGPMMRAIDWFAQFIGADGLLTIPEVFGWETGGTPDRPAKTVWNFIDWQGDVQLKGEAARLTINCQYYGALATAAELAESAGRAGDAARWRSARESLAAPLLAAVTGGGAGFEHVAAYAALTKLAPQLASSVAANALAGRMQSDFLYLWFALKSIEDSPAALMRGLRDAMAPAIRDGFGTVLETRGTLTQPTTALCQGVGACGGYFLNRIVAGLQPSPRRQRQVLVRPWLDEVEWVEAVTPVADGDIAISLRRRKSGIDGEIRLPSGWDWHSDGPAGLTIRSR